MAVIPRIWEEITSTIISSIHGIKLSQLNNLEKLYEVNIQVHSLANSQKNGEDNEDERNTPDIAATLIHRPHCH